MSNVDEKLVAIAAQLKKGVAPPAETVRSILSWFDARRRGHGVVSVIRNALKKHGLTTSPDFEYAWLDSAVSFVAERNGSEDSGVEQTVDHDPTFRIGRLEAANRKPTSVPPDATLQQAVTIMLTNDFSQLPVMRSPRDLKGIVSWKTIGSRLALKRPCKTVRDGLESAQVISAEASLFEAIERIATRDYVLVQGSDRTILGIVTASDFNLQFRSLAEPFLLVGEIESGVRRMLHGNFTVKELAAVRKADDQSRPIERPSDLTFGEYVRLLESESHWKRLEIEIDRVEFLKNLGRVRDIRNDVMHFDPDGMDPEDLRFLREFAQFMKRLRDVGAL